jgi:hypothetical protein
MSGMPDRVHAPVKNDGRARLQSSGTVDNYTHLQRLATQLGPSAADPKF